MFIANGKFVNGRIIYFGQRQCSTNLFPRTEFIDIREASKNVFHVRLNRPQSRNAFTLPLWRELRSTMDFLATYSKCRSIVISAAGKSFCTGIDLKEGITELTNIVQHEGMDISRKSRLIRDLIAVCQDSFTSLEKCPKPIVAAVHNHCIGAGVSLITAADIRYASADAIFSIREVHIGLAADVGILNRINRIVGNDSLTRELAFTGRDIGSSEALKYGLISRQFATAEECLNGALNLAREIARRSPIAVQGTKLTLNYSRNHNIDDSMNFIRTWNQSQLQSDDLVKAALLKEKAHFDDI